MGTSNSFGRPNGNTPLVPSWLGQTDSQEANENGDISALPIAPIPPKGDPNRFTIARNNFSRFIKSGGNDRSYLEQAISNYISHSTGGYRKAAQRMGISKKTAVKLAGFLYASLNQGAIEALKIFNLENFVGRPIEEIFAALSDYICPSSGLIDEGISRGAFIEMIVELSENGITDLESITPENIHLIFELYATHSIEARLYNDIGSKVITLPDNIENIENIQIQLHDLIRRGVSDASHKLRAKMGAITSDIVQKYINQLYEESFLILTQLGEA